MTRFRLTLALLALLLAGCGDDEEQVRTVTTPANSTVRVVADEYSFDPETLVVEGAGSQAQLEIALRNDGALAHNLRLMRDGSEVGGTPTFQGGETRSGTVAVTPGSYEMVCTVGNHADLGMTGTLEVR